VAGHTCIAQGPQCHADTGALRIVIIIAYPRLEQVAEDVQRLCLACRSLQERVELRERRGEGGIEVQIGDEQCSQDELIRKRLQPQHPCRVRSAGPVP